MPVSSKETVKLEVQDLQGNVLGFEGKYDTMGWTKDGLFSLTYAPYASPAFKLLISKTNLKACTFLKCLQDRPIDCRPTNMEIHTAGQQAYLSDIRVLSIVTTDSYAEIVFYYSEFVERNNQYANNAR